MSTAYLISLTTDASDRVPLFEPLIYHKQGRGEDLQHSQAKIEREREWERDRSRENEIKRREK